MERVASMFNNKRVRLAALAVAGCTAIALTGGIGTASAGTIVGSFHDLSATGGSPNKFTGATEICVFCHTPHGADTSSAVPLWNRAISTPPTYTLYSQLGTTTLNGGILPVGSVSIACLSCHDGTQAMNSMINQPGSGWANTTPMVNGGWAAGTGPTTGTYGTPGVAPACAQLGAGCDATDVIWIGTDLRNDHPVGVEYCGGGLSGGGGTVVSGTCVNPDFVAPVSKTVNNTQVFWVDTAGGTAGKRDKTDMILYTRNFVSVGGAAVEPSVECASCHDPHNPTNGTFLRVANTGSAVCLSCHVK